MGTQVKMRAGGRWGAFTLLEVLVVVVILGILAAIVVPQFGGAVEDARASALKSGVGGVRSAVAGFRSRALLAGDDPYPTLAELTTAGTVLEGGFPQNPFNKLTTVQAVTQAQANARAVVNQTSYGWNYFVDNTSDPAVAIFYANSDDQAELDGNGDPVQANDL